MHELGQLQTNIKQQKKWISMKKCEWVTENFEKQYILELAKVFHN